MFPAVPILVEGSSEFDAKLDQLMRRGGEDLDAVAPVVREILADVRRSGEAGVRRSIEAFERRRPAKLVLRDFDGAGALARLEASLRDALALAAARITRFHERQREPGFRYVEEGIELGVRVRPLARVGVYAPGGKARYPSSVLMAAIPARVAGVADVVLATPAPDDRRLAAAPLAGVTTVLDAGGAHAIAALAYGIAGLPRVDKIVGPGNAYVACAKRLVFGEVAIDGIAGPSEIVALADASADARLVAADLLSQAEHDEAAYAVLVTDSRAVAEAVVAETARQLETLERRDVAAASLAAHAAVLVTRSRERMIEVADRIGGEHVALHVADPEGALARLENAGAALLGAETPVAVADYMAGPSHVLPTGGNVRFASPLGVHDFVVRTSVVRYGAEALARQAPAITTLARAEGLDAHARAVEARLGGPPAASARPASAVREAESET
ncbi:MAG TPA: histidinol dehydrogenase [Minicystis sp.]|nr:histidinol dehydrogenase [Minicystis sp.]